MDRVGGLTEPLPYFREDITEVRGRSHNLELYHLSRDIPANKLPIQAIELGAAKGGELYSSCKRVAV
jgi:hypothetical protein